MAGQKRKKSSTPTVEDLLLLGKDMMNRSEKKMGAPETEERRFRELFGVSPTVALIAWNLMDAASLLPKGGSLKHWLWTLCFLKVYAKEQPMCSLCGGIDPKTLRKWVHAFIEAFTILEGAVVSITITAAIHSSSTRFLTLLLLCSYHRSFGRID
jgi:hypothetical protein